MYCEKCGARLPVGATFCEKCGHRKGAPTKRSKQNKKSGCLGWAVKGIAFFLAFGMIGSCMGPSKDPEETTAAAVETTQITEPEETTEATELAATVEDLAAMVEYVASQAYENYEVSYSETDVTLSFWKEGVAAATMLAANGDQEQISAWNELINNLVETNAEFKNIADENGLLDVRMRTKIVNEYDHERILLAIEDGQIVYDCVEDQPEPTETEAPTEPPAEMVYIPASGSKYHRWAGCSNMSNPRKVTKSQAISSGYSPCKRCY